MIKLILLLIEAVIVVVLIIGLVFTSHLGNFTRVGLNQKAIDTNQVDKSTQASFSGYTTIALFGLDNRQQGKLKTGNSDVIMIMSINNDTKDIKLVSVYRDTYLNVSGDDSTTDFRKCNAAYAYGGENRAVSMLNKNLDLKIDNYVSFDFKSVAQAINILGGVDINISSQEELDYLNFYIKHTNGILHTHAKSVNGTGKQHLNGVQAVAYARIRYTAGGDYKRAQRQRVVFSKMMKKAKKADILTLNKIIKKVFPNIQTGLSQSEIISMASVMIHYDMKDSRGFPFYKNTETVGVKGSCVIPCDLETNVSRLHKYLYGNSNYTPSDTIQQYNKEIIAETGYTKDSADPDDFQKGDNFDGKQTNSSSGNGTTGTGSAAYHD